MTVVKDMETLLEALSKQQDHAKATVLAFQVVELAPELVLYAQALEQAKVRESRSLYFKCEWCGDEFRVYRSEYESGRKAGKYCSLKCIEAHRAEKKANK